MAFLDPVWSVLHIVDGVHDHGRSRHTSRFELETGGDGEREAALRVANDRRVRQSSSAEQGRATEPHHEHPRPAHQTDAQPAGREPSVSRSGARHGNEASSDARGGSITASFATPEHVGVGHAIGAPPAQGAPADVAIIPSRATGDDDAVVGSPVRPISQHDATEAQVNRRAAAIAAAYRTAGDMDAARELRMRTRDLPPALAGEVIVAARATITEIAVGFGRQAGGGERVERITREEGALSPMRADAEFTAAKPDRSTRLQQIAIDVAATVEHAGRGPRGALIASDIAALILETAGAGGDEYRLWAFARGVPFGTGLTLPLALAEKLARQGDRRRQRQMLLAIEQGLTRLKQRIAAAVSALAELAMPLAALLEADADVIDRDRIAAALGDYVAGDAHFLDVFAGRLDCVDIVGHDAFCALDVLARQRAIPAELCAIRNDLLADPATAFAIAQSTSAQAAALRHSAVGDRQVATPSIEATTQAVERVYGALGFSAARSALLANATVTWHSVIQMEAGWTASSCSPDVAEQGRVFAALLRFFGAGVPRHIRAIELADVDSEDFAHPVCGLPLLRDLQQIA